MRGLDFEEGAPVGEREDPRRYDWVVLATSVPGAKSIINGSRALDDRSSEVISRLSRRINQMKVAPPYKVARLWFDRQPKAGTPDIIETPQHPPINLITQFHLLEDESAEWARRTSGSVLEFHLYANEALGGMGDDEVWPYIRQTARNSTGYARCPILKPWGPTMISPPMKAKKLSTEQWVAWTRGQTIVSRRRLDRDSVSISLDGKSVYRT